MAASSTKVFILQVMGRHAGWIAAAGGLAAQAEGQPPHIILFPEIPFERESFIAKVKKTVEKSGYCVVVASEGVTYADGGLLSGSLAEDAFGHKQLGGVAPALCSMIKNSLGYKYHYAVADYLQRSARHLASKTDVDQAYAVGRVAVEKAIEGKNAIMVSIQRGSGSVYSWSLGEAPLQAVANREKKMPRSFISEDGFGITQQARDYLLPLMVGEDYPPYKNGMPYYPALKNKLIAKRCKQWTLC
jgi:6-phosphofructokinase